MSLLTDSKGTPLCAVLHRANKNDALTLKHTLETFKRKVTSHQQFSSLLADKRDTMRLIAEPFVKTTIWNRAYPDDAQKMYFLADTLSNRRLAF